MPNDIKRVQVSLNVNRYTLDSDSLIWYYFEAFYLLFYYFFFILFNILFSLCFLLTHLHFICPLFNLLFNIFLLSLNPLKQLSPLLLTRFKLFFQLCNLLEVLLGHLLAYLLHLKVPLLGHFPLDCC